MVLLDTGFSGHMSWDKGLFKKFKSLTRELMTFRGGSTTIIEGKRSINILGLPTFHNFLFVNGLKSNILNINQFCDQNYSVQFSKNKCNIHNYVGLLMKGARTIDNCYGISTLTTLGCHKVTLDSTDLISTLETYQRSLKWKATCLPNL